MVMRLPRPASPRAFWADLKSFFGTRPRHQWIALALALLIPTAIGVTFMFDMRDAQTVAPKVIFVNDWRANRSLQETEANINAVAERTRQYREQRRQEFKAIDDALKNRGL